MSRRPALATQAILNTARKAGAMVEIVRPDGTVIRFLPA